MIFNDNSFESHIHTYNSTFVNVLIYYYYSYIIEYRIIDALRTTQLLHSVITPIKNCLHWRYVRYVRWILNSQMRFTYQSPRINRLEIPARIKRHKQESSSSKKTFQCTLPFFWDSVIVFSWLLNNFLRNITMQRSKPFVYIDLYSFIIYSLIPSRTNTICDFNDQYYI